MTGRRLFDKDEIRVSILDLRLYIARARPDFIGGGIKIAESLIE